MDIPYSEKRPCCFVYHENLIFLEEHEDWTVRAELHPFDIKYKGKRAQIVVDMNDFSDKTKYPHPAEFLHNRNPHRCQFHFDQFGVISQVNEVASGDEVFLWYGNYEEQDSDGDREAFAIENYYEPPTFTESVTLSDAVIGGDLALVSAPATGPSVPTEVSGAVADAENANATGSSGSGSADRLLRYDAGDGGTSATLPSSIPAISGLDGARAVLAELVAGGSVLSEPSSSSSLTEGTRPNKRRRGGSSFSSEQSYQRRSAAQKREDEDRQEVLSWPTFNADANYFEPDIRYINQRTHKMIVGNEGRMIRAVGETLRDDGVLVLKPTAIFLEELGKVQTWLAKKVSGVTGAEAARHFLKQYHDDYWNHSLLCTRKLERNEELTDYDKCKIFYSWKQIDFTKGDDRLMGKFPYCGVFRPFLKLIGHGLQRFFDKYIPTKGYLLDNALTQLLLSGSEARPQLRHGDGDNNFLSALFCFLEPHPFRFWKQSHVKWSALRHVYARGFPNLWAKDEPTPMTRLDLEGNHVILLDQRTLHAGDANPYNYPHARGFFVFKPVDPHEYMRGTNKVLKFEPPDVFNRFFPECEETERASGSKKRNK